jgi:ABC-type tungstate transport system permease subunit
MFESSRGGIAAVVTGACLVLATAAPQAGASVITVNPAADAFVSSSNASKNYGAALAARFVDFLASEKGQKIVRDYGKDPYGEALYRDARYARQFE